MEMHNTASEQPTAKLPDGLKVRTLRDLLSDGIPEKNAILSPWCDERHLCMIHAPTGVGKSLLALSIGLAIAGGGNIFGWHAPTPKKVLLIDGEMDIEDIQTRSKLLLPTVDGDQLAASMNFMVMARQDQDIGVKFPDLASEEGQDRCIEQISLCDPDIIILDNFSTLCDVENENDASSFNSMLTFLSRLKQGRKCVFLIHHSRKGSGGNGTYRGTTKMATPFNSIISLAIPKVPDQGGAHFELRWEKFRGLRVASMSDLDVKLINAKWLYTPLQADNAAKLAVLVRTLEFPDQHSLADALRVSQGQISKLKAQAIAAGCLTLHEYEECMRQAKKLRDEMSAEEYLDDAIPDF